MMNPIKILLVGIMIAITFSACDETIVLDLGQVDQKIVIEGLITTDNTNHFVKVTNTKGFYDSGSTPRVIDAVVTVDDNMGNSYNFVHNPNNETGLNGYYFSENVFAGQEGGQYTLTVNVNGEIYTATDNISTIGVIDSLTYEIDVEEYKLYEKEYSGALAEYEAALQNGDSLQIAHTKLEVDRLERYYAVYFNAHEPQESVDFYLFKFYRNNEIVLEFGTDVYVSDDELLAGDVDNLEIADYYALGDTVTTEMHSISREAFLYYMDLNLVLNNDGGMFSPIPANPRNNLSNDALGFFLTSAVDRASIIIKE